MKKLLFLSALCLAFLIFNPPNGIAQSRDERNTSVENDTQSSLDLLFNRAREFELKNRWREAITTYKIIERFAEGKALVRARDRINFCTINLFMEARYSRRSYLKYVKNLTHSSGIKFFDEVEHKIATYYIEEIDLKKLFIRGLTFLKIALKNRVVRSRFPELSSTNKSDELLRVIDTLLKQVGKKPSLSVRDCKSYLTTLSAHNNINNIKVPPGLIFLECVQGMLSGLDPYCYLLMQDLAEELDILTRGELIGTGADVVMEDHAPKVVGAPRGTPAKRAGLQPGDRIIEIDGEPVESLTRWAIEKKLRGKIGEKISLLVKRDGNDEPIEVTISLATVTLPSVKDSKLLDSKIGYIRLDKLHQRTKSDLEAAIADLESKGMKALIIDLRDNKGGLLDVAVAVANMFLSDGVIVSIRGRWKLANRKWFADMTDTRDQLPIAVLINGNSASGAEIIASALSDHKRAILVGTRTKGKGSVQTTIQLNTIPAVLNLTVAKYYPPSGKSFDGTGILPDIVVENTAATNGQPAPFDAQLRAAVKALTETLRK